MPYDTSSLGYLKRARARLEEATREALFYAAYELRCGIEARMQEYLFPQEEASEQRKTDYKVNRLRRELEEFSLPDDQVMEFSIVSKDGELLETLYYTPVTEDLAEKWGRMGNLLHSLTSYYPDDDPWWEERRELLEDTFEGLKRANAGSLLGAAQLNPQTRKGRLHVEVPAGIEVQLRDRVGEKIRVRVEYLDAVPDEVVRDFWQDVVED